MIKQSAMRLAQASDGNPIISTITVIMFYLFFNFFEAVTEKLIFGHRFEHWLDPIFIAAFIGYAAYGVYACAVHNYNQYNQD